MTTSFDEMVMNYINALVVKSKKDRQHNGQEIKDKETNNDLQNITHKTKDRVTRTLPKTRAELRSI
jgi:hypothetical protein